MAKHKLSEKEKIVIATTVAAHGPKIGGVTGSAIVFLSNSDLDTEEAWDLYEECLVEYKLGHLLDE